MNPDTIRETYEVLANEIPAAAAIEEARISGAQQGIGRLASAVSTNAGGNNLYTYNRFTRPAVDSLRDQMVMQGQVSGLSKYLTDLQNQLQLDLRNAQNRAQARANNNLRRYGNPYGYRPSSGVWVSGGGGGNGSGTAGSATGPTYGAIPGYTYSENIIENKTFPTQTPREAVESGNAASADDVLRLLEENGYVTTPAGEQNQGRPPQTIDLSDTTPWDDPNQGNVDLSHLAPWLR